MMKGSMIYTKGLQEQIETLKTELVEIRKQKQSLKKKCIRKHIGY